MSTAAKVFTIIGMVISILSAIVNCISGLAMFLTPELVFAGAISILINIIFAIASLIIGIESISEIDTMYPSIAISILNLLFVNLIGGILMLCMRRDY